MRIIRNKFAIQNISENKPGITEEFIRILTAILNAGYGIQYMDDEKAGLI